MKNKVNEFEIENEEDLKKCIRKLLNVARADKEEIKAKAMLYVELEDMANKALEMFKKITGEEKETVEELEMMVEAHENVLNTYEKILEKRKSY